MLGASQTGPETTIYHKWPPKEIISIYMELADILFFGKVELVFTNLVFIGYYQPHIDV
jgi:hypothetical protein